MTLSCTPTAQTQWDGCRGWLDGVRWQGAYVCMCVRVCVVGWVWGESRDGVKRCRGACVMSLWKSIDSCCMHGTLHHTCIQVYTDTHMHMRPRVGGWIMELHAEKWAVSLLLCFPLPQCTESDFKVRLQDGERFHYVYFCCCPNIFLSIKSPWKTSTFFIYEYSAEVLNTLKDCWNNITHGSNRRVHNFY